ncbi:stressosome-associated protein Prli42 [Cohnella algarum]
MRLKDDSTRKGGSPMNNKRLFKIIVYVMLFAMVASTVLMSVGTLIG